MSFLIKMQEGKKKKMSLGDLTSFVNGWGEEMKGTVEREREGGLNYAVRCTSTHTQTTVCCS